MNKTFRKPLIAGNWKMNMLPGQVRPFADALLAERPDTAACQVAVCPAFVCIPAAAEAFGGKILVGAQNVNEHDAGAYTGEVSAAQLCGLGVHFVILGHSERRQYYGETDASVNAKLRHAVQSGLAPIVCVGETLEQREQGVTSEHIRAQVEGALRDVDAESARSVVFAYEPIWAIGTGRTATAAQAGQVCGEIRATVARLYGEELARPMRILYGGSMNEKNADELLAEPDIDGGLIGGASLVPEKFAAIIRAAVSG